MVPADLKQKSADDPNRAAPPSLRSLPQLVSLILLVKPCQFGINGYRASWLHEGEVRPLWAQRGSPMFAWGQHSPSECSGARISEPDSGLPEDPGRD